MRRGISRKFIRKVINDGHTRVQQIGRWFAIGRKYRTLYEKCESSYRIVFSCAFVPPYIWAWKYGVTHLVFLMRLSWYHGQCYITSPACHFDGNSFRRKNDAYANPEAIQAINIHRLAWISLGALCVKNTEHGSRVDCYAIFLTFARYFIHPNVNFLGNMKILQFHWPFVFLNWF